MEYHKTAVLAFICLLCVRIAHGQINIPQVQTPQPPQFQQTNVYSTQPIQAQSPKPIFNPQQTNNAKLIQEAEYNEYQKILQEQKTAKIINDNNQPTINTTHYQKAFKDLMDMQKGITTFSLKKAVFIVENAYLDDTLNYELYNKKIQSKVKLLQYLFTKENIQTNNDLGKNFVIQQLFSDTLKDMQGKRQTPFYYDFTDYRGEKDWSKMFVSKLLFKGNGQCHSMPLLYLILAEETKTKAWLTLAPEHSLIMFSDNTRKNFYYYETTNGYIVTDNWLMNSGYITSSALKNKIYMDTVSQSGLIEACLGDLIVGYQIKFGHDGFCNTMLETLITWNPKNIQAQLIKSNVLTYEMLTLAKKYKLTSKQQFSAYPDLYKIYNETMKEYDYVDNLGFVEMPKEAYQAWLLSLQEEKTKQEMRLLKTTIKANAKNN